MTCSAWPSSAAADAGSAVATLEKVTRSPETPSVHHARAVLGTLLFPHNAFEGASEWWPMLDAPRRTELKLDETLHYDGLPGGMQTYETGRYEHAADKLRKGEGPRLPRPTHSVRCCTCRCSRPVNGSITWLAPAPAGTTCSTPNV